MEVKEIASICIMRLNKTYLGGTRTKYDNVLSKILKFKDILSPNSYI